VLSATGFAPLGLWPLALLAVGLLALLAERAPSWRKAALLGWLFGIGHFTLGNWWIATAFTYQANIPAALGWAAVPLLSLYLAIYPALAAAGARALAGRVALPLGLAALWILGEWLRSWVFTGYPWNPFGIVLLGPFDRPGLAALAPWMGTYALSGLAVLVGCGLVLALAARRWVPALVATALLALGMYLPAGDGRQGTERFTLVQPDVRQEQLNDPRTFEAVFQRTAELSRPLAPDAERLVLWPESGVPDYLEDGYPARYYRATTAFGSPVLARRRIGRTIGAGSTLLTGAVDLVMGRPGSGGGRAGGAYNTVTPRDAAGGIGGSYAQAHRGPNGA
jgi:apolipoprotein N-acyltransferase